LYIKAVTKGFYVPRLIQLRLVKVGGYPV